MVETPPTAANLRQQATLTIECFQDHRVQCYPCEPLRRDLLKLRVEEKSYGIRLVSPRDGEGHGDTASAFCLALLLAHQLAGTKPTYVGTVDCMAGLPSTPGKTATTPDHSGLSTPLSRAMRNLEIENDTYQLEQQRFRQAGADHQGQFRQMMFRCGRTNSPYPS
jgi:hypothetical protein